MAGICGRHRERVETCRLCNLTPSDILPDWDKKVAEAEAAGLHNCEHCGFTYYLTCNMCPKCNGRGNMMTWEMAYRLIYNRGLGFKANYYQDEKLRELAVKYESLHEEIKEIQKEIKEKLYPTS